MEYLKIEGEFPKLANCAVTMGKFDGIHRGHRKLVEKIRERKTLGEQAVLFAIDASSNMILTSQERASLLEKLGVDVLVWLRAERYAPASYGIWRKVWL